MRRVPIAPPFHPPGSNSDLHPHMDRLLGPQGIGQAGSDKVDTDEADEVIDTIAKTVAELTSQQDGVIRQQVIEHLMRQICTTTPSFAAKRRPPQSALGEALTAIRATGHRQFDPTAMLDRAGGHLAVQQAASTTVSHRRNGRTSVSAQT